MLVRIAAVMGAGRPGGASLMEDYTYHMVPGEELSLGAHMLEVSPSLSSDILDCIGQSWMLATLGFERAKIRSAYILATLCKERDLLNRLRKTFADNIRNLTREELLEVRRDIEQAYWRFAFDGKFPNHPSMATLLWHFSPWELHRLHREQGLAPEQILAPRVCEQTVVLMCDLCSFSSFVRDTRDSQLIRRKLTEFYSLARHAVHNAGGVVYQFVGDEVVALFGLHEPPEVAAGKASACAQALFGIGHAVSDSWQRALDRVQPSRGVHIGMAVGDLNLLPLRPFSRTHIGLIGDAINMAARLRAEAKADEAVLSNGLYRLLGDDRRAGLVELEPVEAENVGRIGAWKMTRAGI
jgi:class 3 adenylate cyclase